MHHDAIFLAKLETIRFMIKEFGVLSTENGLVVLSEKSSYRLFMRILLSRAKQIFKKRALTMIIKYQ